MSKIHQVYVSLTLPLFPPAAAPKAPKVVLLVRQLRVLHFVQLSTSTACATPLHTCALWRSTVLEAASTDFCTPQVRSTCYQCRHVAANRMMYWQSWDTLLLCGLRGWLIELNAEGCRANLKHQFLQAWN